MGTLRRHGQKRDADELAKLNSFCYFKFMSKHDVACGVVIRNMNTVLLRNSFFNVCTKYGYIGL